MKDILKFFTITLFSMMFVACESYDPDNDNNERNSLLKVDTRATTENGDMRISYPINIFVFDDDENCVATAQAESESDEISFKLLEGVYDVFAIAGADDENYDIPSVENATKKSVITLKEDCEHNDLMAASGHVTLSDKEGQTLTLTLERKVLFLETVTISDVPTDVSAVMVTIGPFYDNILLDGTYQENDMSVTLSLTKQNDGTTWKTVCKKYLLEAHGRATVKVSLVDTKISSWTYTSNDELKANHKINIKGTYTEPELTLKGEINGVEWDEPCDVTFEFGGTTTENEDEQPDNGGNEDNDNNDDSEENEDAKYSIGDIYAEGCMIVKCEDIDGITVLTLMSTKDKDKLTFDEDSQESIRNAVNAGLAELAVDGISGWRLPLLDELKYVESNKDVINQFLRKNAGENFVTGGSVSYDYSYYYSDADGNIKAYNTSTSDANQKLKNESASLILRAFATITIEN